MTTDRNVAPDWSHGRVSRSPTLLRTADGWTEPATGTRVLRIPATAMKIRRADGGGALSPGAVRPSRSTPTTCPPSEHRAVRQKRGFPRISQSGDESFRVERWRMCDRAVAWSYRPPGHNHSGRSMSVYRVGRACSKMCTAQSWLHATRRWLAHVRNELLQVASAGRRDGGPPPPFERTARP